METHSLSDSKNKFITNVLKICKKVIFKDVSFKEVSPKEEKGDKNKFNSNDMALVLTYEKESRIICECGNDEFKWFGSYVICPECGNKMKKTGKKGRYQVWFRHFDLINERYSSNWEKQSVHSPNQNTVTVAEDVRVVCN